MITVNVGSQEEPITMGDLAASATTSDSVDDACFDITFGIVKTEARR